MKGNATALKAGQAILINVPKAIVRMLDIKPGNLVEFDIENPYPDKIQEKRRSLNFKKKQPELREITTT